MDAAIHALALILMVIGIVSWITRRERAKKPVHGGTNEEAGGTTPPRGCTDRVMIRIAGCSPATVGRSWRIVREEVGIPHRLHDLRHFFASGLIAGGCDVVTVQRTLGHSTAAITLTTYSHLWPNAND